MMLNDMAYFFYERKNLSIDSISRQSWKNITEMIFIQILDKTLVYMTEIFDIFLSNRDWIK